MEEEDHPNPGNPKMLLFLLTIHALARTHADTTCTTITNTLDLAYDYSGDLVNDNPSYMAYAEMKVHGASTPYFNQPRNSGKNPFIKGVQKFLKLKINGQVEISHAYTIFKGERKEDSIMICQLIVKHTNAVDANRTMQAFESAQQCDATLLELNTLIKEEMLVTNFISFQNTTIRKVEILAVSVMDRAALITITFWCGFVALITCVYLVLQNNNNLELFAINPQLYLPITIRRT